MLFRNAFAAAATLGVALIAPATSFADGAPAASSFANAAPATQPCILHDHHIVSVTPYNVEERDWRGHLRTRLGGAAIYVQAEPGLTAEWLNLELSRHFNEMHGAATMPDCVFALDGVTIDVQSAGAGFSVKLVAPDKAKAEEILRRAQLLVG